MAKLDAEERQAAGLPVPANVTMYLRQLTDEVLEAGEAVDSYDAAGIEKPDLSRLDESYLATLHAAKRPNLAIEALRRAIEQAMRSVTRHNVVQQQRYSDQLIELMNRYRNGHLTAAEVISELVAMAHDVTADADRGRAVRPSAECRGAGVL